LKIVPYLKQYVATKLALGKIIVTTLRPNPVIALVAIDPLMVVIHVQVGKNMVEDVILHGGSSVNIMVDYGNDYGLLIPNQHCTHFKWWIKPSPNPLDSSRTSKFTFMEFLTL